ncbi:MAG: thioredoxin domain-containing protein [Verrucomicrobia bacterium]|nr:thioredoxin domain-containing protein [Verrucomicrobiota bacterium]MBS0646091.1 thioredoxin domain-containing protein [Verrucomicrobiota bacterium]
MSHHPLYTNRLVHEKSPYLLQHAHDPVDWYPWGEEAFKDAREKDRPIFLSIGYATCHWCHLMETESFQNIEVAQLMNESFINIKVDREEMPEVDGLYMEFAQAMMSGGAGWPLNLVLTPELEPFFAATYLPADASRGFLGVKQLVMRIRQIWNDAEERELVCMQAGKIVDIFAGQVEDATTRVLPPEQQLVDAEELLFKTADPIYGGMKGSPKFPVGFQACFLLQRCKMKVDSRALFYVERTLEMMHRGGIYDHLAGGFARYCIDEQWMIPHFEKMLYDNAVLARVYLEAWEYTHHALYKEVSCQILDYLLEQMQYERGGFFSAQDSDTDGHEGQFYTWSWQELQDQLDGDASLYCEFYGATPTGNFKGRNILHMPQGWQEFANYRRMDASQLKDVIKQLNGKLLEARYKRKHPTKDDKIITSYNALAVSSLVEAGLVLSETKYLDAAEKAALFIREHLWEEGVLKRRWRDGEARYDGILDDYAFMIQASLSLFEADRGTQWLEFALTLVDILENDFKADHGAYYLTNGKDPNLLLRRCEFYDGAEPSGNAVQAENFLRLYQMTAVEEYKKRAEQIFSAAYEHIALYPPGACYHLLTLQRYYNPKVLTFIIALNEKEELKEEITQLFAQFYLPHKVVIWSRGSDEELRDLVPTVRGKEPLEGQTTLYICYPDRCLEPVVTLPKIQEALSNIV